jgi:hypothetical protein
MAEIGASVGCAKEMEDAPGAQFSDRLAERFCKLVYLGSINLSAIEKGHALEA